MALILACLGAFAVTLLTCLVFAPVARHYGLVDVPDSRKLHVGSVPLIGGIAVFVGLCFGMLITDAAYPLQRGVIAGAVLVLLVGVVDDYFEISARLRMAAQGLAVLLAAAVGGALLRDLGALVDGAHVIHLGLLSWPFTVFAVVGIINAYNMTDGVDGLSGSLALVTLAAIVFWLAGTGHSLIASAVILCAALAGFLALNAPLPGRRQASVFLGDAGSTLLGFLIACWLVQLAQGSERLLPPVLALYLVALPLMDAVFLMGYRALSGRSPMSADREHLHHVLQRRGWSKGALVIGMAGLHAVLIGVGLAAAKSGWSEPAMCALFLGLALLYVALRLVLRHAEARDRGVLQAP